VIRAFDVVLFDNDGVLVDTEPLFLRATQELLATVGVEVDAEVYRAISLVRGGSVFELAEGDYARHKPHPDPYLAAAARFGVAPERCLVIEDTQRGLAAAHAAGMRCIAIPQELSLGSDFTRAVRVLDSMEELAGLLEL
jgi:beta-phosphoglucomutase-like phosphatase (HAD superfamily)